MDRNLLPRRELFEAESYLSLENGYPERDLNWIKSNILPVFARHITGKQRGLDVECDPHLALYCEDLTDKNISSNIKERYDLFYSNAVIPHIPIASKEIAFTNIASLAMPGATFVLYDGLKGIDDNTSPTGVADDFVSVFSVQWLEDCVKEWAVSSIKQITPGTNEIILKLR